jgi:hypothetical protein
MFVTKKSSPIGWGQTRDGVDIVFNGGHFVTVDILTVDILSVDILTVDILTVDILTVDILTVEILSGSTFWHYWQLDNLQIDSRHIGSRREFFPRVGNRHWHVAPIICRCWCPSHWKQNWATANWTTLAFERCPRSSYCISSQMAVQWICLLLLVSKEEPPSKPETFRCANEIKNFWHFQFWQLKSQRKKLVLYVHIFLFMVCTDEIHAYIHRYTQENVGILLDGVTGHFDFNFNWLNCFLNIALS